MKLKALALAAPLLFFSGCAKERKHEQAPPEPPKPVETRVSALDELKGQWQSNCLQGRSLALSAKADLGVTESSQLTIEDENVTEIATIGSFSCEDKDIEIKVIGRYDLKSTQDTRAGGFNIAPISFRVRPMTEFGVRVLKIAKWCGLEDWRIFQERDVTDRIGKDKCFKDRALGTLYSIDGGRLSFRRTGEARAAYENNDTDRNDFYFTRL